MMQGSTEVPCTKEAADQQVINVPKGANSGDGVVVAHSTNPTDVVFDEVIFFSLQS